MSASNLYRKHGISAATFYKFKAKFGGMDVSDARRLKALEDENARLKKLLAEQMLDNAILKDVAAKKMVTPDAKRKAVARACEVHGVSQRRACQALKIDRSTVRYTSIRPDDAPLPEALKAVAAARRRFGYRRIHVMLDRQGIVMNQKKLRRLYREEKLQVRRRGGRKRALGARRPMLVPDRANTRWSLDFVSDTFTDGRRFRVLAVVNDYTRECLALIADTSLSGLRVVRELDAIIRWRGRPDTIVSDNGPEFIAEALGLDRHRRS
ncbi:IS3 family transposase ISRle4 [Afipia felis]